MVTPKRLQLQKTQKHSSKSRYKKQHIFIQRYKRLLKKTNKDEPILFGDGVHPTMQTKITYGWIKKGKDKPIKTTASKNKMNIMGAIEIKTMKITVNHYDTLNSYSIAKYLIQLKRQYRYAPKIHLILDRGRYNFSKKTRINAKRLGINLYYLPTYSPNLNPIERLWKVVNEKVRNNQYFEKPKEFREKIMNFFITTWPSISDEMRSRINDNFQLFDTVTSS